MRAYEHDADREAAGVDRASASPARPPDAALGLTASSVLRLQRCAGNRATVEAIATAGPAGPLAVQRCGPEPCDCGPEERAAKAEAQ